MQAHRFCLMVGLALWATPLPAQTNEGVGPRPYELDWAQRQQDQVAPLVDFEDLSGWQAECQDASATFSRTREQQIWGRSVGKLIYRGTGANPRVRITPPHPITIPGPFDAVTLWCYGNNWGWAPDPKTPQVSLAAVFEDAAGHEFEVSLYHVDWTEWSLLHKRLSPAQIARAQAGAKFKALLVTNGRNTEERTLYFDNLAVFVESFPPLKFEPRPERGIAPLPGASPGANTGPGRLPFPTRPETILPDNLGRSTRRSGMTNQTSFFYQGDDGELEYHLSPRTGTWSDLEVSGRFPRNGDRFATHPCLEGGVYLHTAKGPALPEKAEHLGTRWVEATLESRWKLTAGGTTTEVTYVYRSWGTKTLAIDVLAPGGGIAEVRYGRADGTFKAARLVTNPFYPAEGGRPAVAVAAETPAPLFLTGNTDWYLSGGSVLWAANSVSDAGVVYNGGTRYLPLTNGKRNDCAERFFITIAPRYEEVLPNIPNPPSPWRQITGTRLWHAHGASDRAQDARLWTDVHRHGLTQLIITDHETMWRDNGESFTFRTRAAPGKGGDPGAYDYARLMQDKLGFVYGPYNNFTDFAPVNEFWNFDMVARTSDNQLQHAWMRCYAPKPARAVEYCARLAPQIQEKFKFSTAYCDVHTAVAPWHRVDYDARVPGAGTFAAVFYSFGEIMLHQKKAWNGPVYSEGNYHSFYMGLTDGNYGQDQSYRPAVNPWLVDFDLRKMHDLGCNFGMGNPEMFYANVPQPRKTRAERDAWLDRFLAATVAFGHPGFLVMEGGMGNTFRSYYLLQQLQSRYCLTNAAEIRYADAQGNLVPTSEAVARGLHQRSQVVTRYADGTVTAANGSRSERLKTDAFGHPIDLPPNGFAGWTADGTIEVFSGDRDGQRCDYAATPAYGYVDGRGRFARFPQAAGNGPAVCRRLPEGKYEVILLNQTEAGFAVEGIPAAVALDKENRELGPAPLRQARGLTYVTPVKGAFSYLLRTTPTTAAPPQPPVLRCDRDAVVPGERVQVKGATLHKLQIPPEARPGEHLWRQFEGAWIDFSVVSLAEIGLTLEGDLLRAKLASHLPKAEAFTLKLGLQEHPLRLTPGQWAELSSNLGAPTNESVTTLPVELRCGEMVQQQTATVRTLRSLVTVALWPEKWTGGMALRGQKETTDFGATGAIVHPQSTRCGAVEKAGLFMHPPWQGGVGYCFALLDWILLPTGQPAAFRASVGKANGSDPGDGILYKVSVLEEGGAETVVASLTVTEHEWKPIEANLTRWAGQRIRLKLVADVGPKDNSSGDWACWADQRVESVTPVLHRTLESAIPKDPARPKAP